MALNGKTYITINTDASYYYEHTIGGYAFYIVCDMFKIHKGGKFKSHPANSTDAEIMAIGNAFATLLAQKEFPKLDVLVLNSDSKNGMREIKQKSTPLGRQVNKLLVRLVRKLGVSKYNFKHVRAHTGKNNGRSLANEWCDKEAKKWARLAVKEKIKKDKTK